jgi:hypothetical protein
VRESRGEGIGGIEWWWWFVFGRESFLAWFQAEVDVYRCWFLFDHWRVFITWFSGLRKAGYCYSMFYPSLSLCSSVPFSFSERPVFCLTWGPSFLVPTKNYWLFHLFTSDCYDK